MRIFLTLLWIISSLGTAWATNYTQDASCQGAWLFKEGSGTTVDDSSQNSNTGNFSSAGHPEWNNTIVPTAYTTYSVKSVSSDYIEAGNNNTLNITGTDISVGGWIRSTSIATEQYIFCRGAYNVDGYYIGIVSSRPQFVLNGVSANFAWSGTALSSDSWYHVMGISNGTNPIKIYTNGTEVASYLTQNNAIAPKASTKTAYLGKYNTAAGYLLGYYSEIGVFNRTLSATEIADIVTNGLAGASSPAIIDDTQIIMVN